MARIQAETAEFKQRQNSTHLWRPHAEALNVLEECAKEAIQLASGVLTTANQRGLVEKAKILTATMDWLRRRVEVSREALAMAGVKPVLQ